MLPYCDSQWVDLRVHGRVLLDSLDLYWLCRCADGGSELSLLQEVPEKSSNELHSTPRVHLICLVHRGRLLQLLRTSCGTVCCGDLYVHGFRVDSNGMLHERWIGRLLGWLRMRLLFRSYSSNHICDHLAFVLDIDFSVRYLCGTFLNIHHFWYKDDHATL